MLKNLNIKKITLWLSVTTIACLAIATLLFFEIDLKDFKSNKYQYNVNEQVNFSIENIKVINIIILIIFLIFSYQFRSGFEISFSELISSDVPKELILYNPCR